MKYMRLFKESNGSIYELFHLDKDIIDILIDICDSFEVDLHIRALMTHIQGQNIWIEIYDSKDWSVNGNRFLYDNWDMSDFKRIIYVDYDIVGDLNTIKEVYDRVKSEFNISLNQAPKTIYNTKNDHRDIGWYWYFNEMQFIERGKMIPMSSKKLAWIPFSILD